MPSLGTAIGVAATQLLLGCGWIGIHLAYPAIEVRAGEVRLGEPLRIVQVEEGSPAARAGLADGMEILAIDEDRWENGTFLSNLVRLQTLEPGNAMSMRVRDRSGERRAEVEAVACDEAQSRERARLLASLGWMQGAALARHDRDAERVRQLLDEQQARAYEEATRNTEAAIEAAERRMNDPEIRARIEEVMRQAEEAYSRAAGEWGASRRAQIDELRREADRVQREASRSLSDPEVEARLATVVAEAEEARRRALRADDPEVTARVEDLLRQAMEAQSEAMERWNGAEGQERLEDMLRQATEAQIRATERLDDPALQERLEEMRAHLDELRSRTMEQLDASEVRERVEEARRALAESRVDAERLSEAQRVAEEAGRLAERSHRAAYERAQVELEQRMAELRAGKPDLDAMRAAREEMAVAMEEVRRHREAMRDVQRYEAERIQEDVRRALSEAERGRTERGIALYHAARAAERWRQAAPLFRGAQFDVVGTGLATHVGVDHGLLIAELEEDSPLAAAGVRPGDVIVAVEGREVGEVGDLFDAVAERAAELRETGAASGTLQVDVQGDGKRRSLTLTIETGSARRGPL